MPARERGLPMCNALSDRLRGLRVETRDWLGKALGKDDEAG